MANSVARRIGVGLTCALAWLAPTGAAAMSLDERVACQATLEDLAWSETHWPESNIEPKPARAQVLSDAALRARVEDQLRMEMVLAQDYGIPIGAAALQRELDRMAVGTRAPARLKRRFEALGNDAERIAECLARPHLVAQQLRAAYAADGGIKRFVRTSARRPFQAWWTERRAASGLMPSTPPATAVRLPDITGQAATRSKAAADTWRVEPPTGSPTEPAVRALHTAVWTGSELIVWGGDDGDLVNTGGRYQPATDVWTATSLIDAPSPRYQHTAIWTGTEMIVWGGCAEGSCGTQTGGRYHPATDTWTPTSLTDAASTRYLHSAVWTGAAMVVWGGYDGVGLNTGARYDPATNTWAATAPTDAPSPRYYHTAVWTGTDMIVWGGQTSSGGLSSGGRYDPITNLWTATSSIDAPSPRYQHTAVWTGADMIIWGGDDGSSLNTGGRYHAASDTWTATSPSSAPSPRYWHTAVWTGTDMIVWGGYDGSRFNTGGRYDPGTDAWAGTSLINAPSARYEHTAVWADMEMIVWGGCCAADRMGVYYPTATTEASTTAILADVPDPSAIGAAVSVNVEVSGSATAPADGQVQVTASSGETCSDTTPTPLDADSASFVCDLVFANAGGRTLTAAFSGSATHDNSITVIAEPHNVKADSLATITAVEPAPSFSGQPLTLSFHVAGSTPTGTVSISSHIEGVLDGCTAVAVGSGACTVTAGELGLGTHQLTASYTGDENHFPSTSVSVEHRVLEFVIDSASPVNGIAGAPLAAADRPRVRVRDDNGEGVAGIGIAFELASGGGWASGTTATTGNDGRATVGGWTLGTQAGANTLAARINGVAGLSPITFTAHGAELADVALTKSSVTTQAAPGDVVTYGIVVTHASGPSDVRAVDILDALPNGLNVATATWLCAGVGGASCELPNGSGDVEVTAAIPVGSSVTVTLTATVAATASGTLTNLAVADLISSTDATPTNNSDDHSFAVVSLATGPCSIFCDGFEDPVE